MAIDDYYRPLAVQRTAQAVDAYGAPATVPDGKPFVIRGHIGQPSSQQIERAAQRGVEVVGRLYTSVDAGVQPFDVVQDDDGRAYQVASQPRDAARRGHHVEADLTEWRWNDAD